MITHFLDAGPRRTGGTESNFGEMAGQEQETPTVGAKRVAEISLLGFRAPLDRVFFLEWGMLFAFWFVLSGMVDVLHLGSGLLCSGLVAVLSHRLLGAASGRTPGETVPLVSIPWRRVAAYTVWLLREIAVANWQVVKIVLDPRMPIDPALIRFRSTLVSDLGITTLANSITLTPGTITVRAEQGEFLIHALVGGEPVVSGVTSMQQHIARALPHLESQPEETG